MFIQLRQLKNMHSDRFINNLSRLSKAFKNRRQSRLSQLKSYVQETYQNAKRIRESRLSAYHDPNQSYFQKPQILKSYDKKNFLKCFQEQSIIQFYEAYIPLVELTPFIEKIRQIYQLYHRTHCKNNHDVIICLPMSYQIQYYLDRLLNAVKDILQISQNKYQKFLKFKLASVLYDYNLLVKILLEISQKTEQIQTRPVESPQKRHSIKQIIKVIYTNLRYMKYYIQLNQETYHYLRKNMSSYLQTRLKFILSQNKNKQESINQANHNKVTFLNRTFISSDVQHLDAFQSSPFFKVKNDALSEKQKSTPDRVSYQEDMDLISYQNNASPRTSLQKEIYPSLQCSISSLLSLLSTDKIASCPYKLPFSSLQQRCKCLYSSLVYSSPLLTSKLQAYTTLGRKVESHKNHFLMGLYIGLGSITLIALFVLLSFNLVEFDYDQDRLTSMNYIFPMFRGIGILIMYLWAMAWNVHGYTTYRINHRLVLQYGSHYSTHFQIMKRAGFFTLIFSFMLLTYCIGQSLSKNQYIEENNIFVSYTPFAVWAVYFFYIFFPNRDVFNPKGRRYFYDLLKKIFFSPVLKITFLITWASDQAVSFVIPFKDFGYTVCFYTSEIKIDDVRECLKTTHYEAILITYVVAILPLLLRMIQCYRQAMQNSGHFKGHIQMWNFLKYFSSVMTATMSYLSTIWSPFFVLFILSSIISTAYSYYWDLKNDWGLLEQKSKYKFLRDKLSYKNPNYYYLAIAVNLIFRCSWTLTISPSIVSYLHKSTFLPFLTGSIQILRRCVWNFLRIQKQHLVNCKDYVIMRPQVQKIYQKLTSKYRQTKIQSFEPHDEAYLGYNKQVKAQLLQQIRQQQKQLAQILDEEEYQREWHHFHKDNLINRKHQYIDFVAKQRKIILTKRKLLRNNIEGLGGTVY